MITAKQNQKAVDVLKEIITNDPENPEARILIARAYGELNQYYESFSERAIYHYLRGNFDFAIEQINTAMTYAPNQTERKRLQATRQQYQTEKQLTEEAMRRL